MLPWKPILTLAACACAVGAVLWSQEAQPDGCPEDGCRVGYRFEDGGIAPEGWEPYVTDDPVVALMDACLTYFMTGMLSGDVFIADDQGDNGLFLGGAESNQTMRVMNRPFQSVYGTFSCDNRFEYGEGSLSEIERWMDFRLTADQRWSVSDSRYWATFQEVGNEAYGVLWARKFESAQFAAFVLIQNYPAQSVVSSGENATLRLWVQSNYHGPFLELGQIPDVVF